LPLNHALGSKGQITRILKADSIRLVGSDLVGRYIAPAGAALRRSLRSCGGRPALFSSCNCVGAERGRRLGQAARIYGLLPTTTNNTPSSIVIVVAAAIAIAIAATRERVR
jgi:hypothetical protein